MLQSDERQERFPTKKEHCSQLFGSFLLERQIKMKLSTVLAYFLGLSTL